MNRIKLSKLKIAYNTFNKKHLLLVQATQTGILFFSGDFIAQTIVEKKKLKEYHYERTFHFVAIGLGIVGPAASLWYKFLERYIGSNSTKQILTKVALDQLVFAPTFLCIFICVLNFLNRKDWEYIKKQLNEKYTDILLINYSIWPFVQTINFYFIPLTFQVLFNQTVALFWNTYLCWKTNK